MCLEEDNKSKVCETINENVKTQTAAFYYHLSRIFHLPSLHKTTFSFLERWFPMVIETKGFLELEVSLILKIFASSYLKIDSEVEIFNAANKWLNQNVEERSKFARKLLLKVRLNLLSEPCLKYLINEFSWISTDDDCLKVLKNRDIFYQNDSATCNKSRHCIQSLFNVLICGGRNTRDNLAMNQVKEFLGYHLEEVKDPPQMLNERFCCTAICFRGEAYVFAGIGSEGNRLTSVEKYCPVKKTWSHVFDIPDDRQYFCCCAFMRKIFICGGHSITSSSLNSCLVYDSETLIWSKQVAEMSVTRSNAACAVYEGNIAVSGGQDRNSNGLRTIESYDPFADTWTLMPNMIEERYQHSLVCVRSKLFAIGGANLNTKGEVFDRISNKFVTIETVKFRSYGINAISIANNILVFHNRSTDLLIYDTDNDIWTIQKFEFTKQIFNFCLLKLPMY